MNVLLATAQRRPAFTHLLRILMLHSQWAPKGYYRRADILTALDAMFQAGLDPSGGIYHHPVERYGIPCIATMFFLFCFYSYHYYHKTCATTHVWIQGYGFSCIYFRYFDIHNSTFVCATALQICIQEQRLQQRDCWKNALLSSSVDALPE